MIPWTSCWLTSSKCWVIWNEPALVFQASPGPRVGHRHRQPRWSDPPPLQGMHANSNQSGVPQEGQTTANGYGTRRLAPAAADMDSTENLMHRRHRKDENQDEILRALRAAGVHCWVISRPCDLLCLYANRYHLLDVDGITKNRKRDPKQLEAFAQFRVRLVKTPEDALAAVGLRVEV